MMKEYDEATLHRVQQMELMVYRDALSICKKYNLNMFLLCGSALGAIRHKGFIPWDDDMDVAMTREDYEELVRHVNEDYSDKYFMLNTGTNKNFPLMHTQMTLRGTKFVPEPLKNVKCPFGIFLDIFVLDKMPNDEKELKKISRKAFFLSKIMILRNVPFPVIKYHGFKKVLVYTVTVIAHFLLVIFRVSNRRIYNSAMKMLSKYRNQKDTKKIAYLFDTFPDMEMFDCDEIYPLREVEFAGTKSCVTGNIEKVLTVDYGDYMQLPPIEDRRNHYPYILDFGSYADASVEDLASGKYDLKI